MNGGSEEEKRVLRWVAKKAREVAGAKQVILFGSRARGDAGERSDFDIAILTDEPEKLSELRHVLEENPLTLLAFDIVDLSSAQEVLRARILAEGVDITEI
ncbi:nucleotidyltransferase domain-containing protein [bacterium]|nr:nucleotidyltransferase domain-containing protein [bacterium]